MPNINLGNSILRIGLVFQYSQLFELSKTENFPRLKNKQATPQNQERKNLNISLEQDLRPRVLDSSTNYYTYFSFQILIPLKHNITNYFIVLVTLPF